MNLPMNGSETVESSGPNNYPKTAWVENFAANGSGVIEIGDNGIGIDQENIKHIFDFGNSYQRSTGMGLYYCHVFVEDNDGT